MLETLSHIVPLYPALHRSLSDSLSKFSLLYLNGAAPQPVPVQLVQSASQLFSVLHHTGGKVGAATQWRKSMDDTISFAWGSLLSLRTTFSIGTCCHKSSLIALLTVAYAGNMKDVHPPVISEDPMIAVPLNLDKLRTSVAVLRDLMQSVTSELTLELKLIPPNRTINHRPVVLPVGSLVRLCVVLLRCTADEKVRRLLSARLTTHGVFLTIDRRSCRPGSPCFGTWSHSSNPATRMCSTRCFRSMVSFNDTNNHPSAYLAALL